MPKTTTRSTELGSDGVQCRCVLQPELGLGELPLPGELELLGHDLDAEVAAGSIPGDEPCSMPDPQPISRTSLPRKVTPISRRRENSYSLWRSRRGPLFVAWNSRSDSRVIGPLLLKRP